MKCGSCGSENRPGVRFCGTCGQALAMSASEGYVAPQQSQMPHEPARQVAPSAALTRGKWRAFLPKMMGCIGWLLVSIGTFIVAYGYHEIWLNEDLYSSLKIEYGIEAYAIAAIFFALSRLTKRD